MSSPAKIEWLPIAQILPNQDNPRHISDDKFQQLVQSIKDMPEMLTARPLVVNQDNVVLGGNMRLKALQEVGAEEVPVMRVDWPEEKQRAFIIKDNVSYGEWDWDVLANEWNETELDTWGLDVWQPEKEPAPTDNPYTTKIEAPVYEPTKKQPELDELTGLGIYQELIDEISQADIPKDIATFLRHAATRHIVFDYEQVAEYYAHAPANVQRLMEASALVIIDFDQAIEQGFVRLHDELKAQYLEEHG